MTEGTRVTLAYELFARPGEQGMLAWVGAHRHQPHLMIPTRFRPAAPLLLLCADTSSGPPAPLSALTGSAEPLLRALRDAFNNNR